ncbi:MAG: class C sortase [Oscillospiraceae bacterium]|nr:class C sortase [Oscillospiraceae bacterium]
MKKWKKAALLLFALMVLVGSVLFTIYPLVSNAVNDKYASVVQTRYTEEIREMDVEGIKEEWTKAAQYNRSLQPVSFSKEALAAAAADYDSLLDMDGSGLMGFLEIPAIQVTIPIYHGTAEETLQKGVGHLAGSALPVGGESTHCVLTGHSGVAGNRLFSDLDQLTEGAVFYLHVLNETLAYRVCEMNTVLPYETELLQQVPGKDLCTLVTCTPYGVNTHRLLVRGERTEYTETTDREERTSEEEPVPSTWKEQYLRGLKIGGICAGSILVIAVPLILMIRRRKRHEA